MACKVKRIEAILATFNGEYYIKQQLESLLCQTRSTNRIIITDACSTDTIVDICNLLLSKGNIEYDILRPKKTIVCRKLC